METWCSIFNHTFPECSFLISPEIWMLVIIAPALIIFTLNSGLNGDVCHWKLLRLSLHSTSDQIFFFFYFREDISMQKDWNDLDKPWLG